jgi:hypothetical protein
MAKYALINYYSAKGLMALFDSCYKMGVKDAIEVNDDIQASEFCEKMYGAEKFGRIIFDYTYDWREWKYRLCQMVCDLGKYRPQCIRFFETITAYNNYLACVLPVAMDFYLMGIKDYYKHPFPEGWVRFEHTPYTLWNYNGSRALKMQDFVRILTGFCYDRIRLDEVAIEAKRNRLEKIRARKAATGQRGRITGTRREPSGLSRSAYETFQREIWQNTRTQTSS